MSVCAAHQDLLELQVALAPLALQAKMAVMASVVQLALAVHVALSAPRETRAWLAVTVKMASLVSPAGTV